MEQLDLGFAGICHETHGVLLRVILPEKGARGAVILSALLLARIAANCAFFSLLEAYYYELVPAVGFAYRLYTVFHLLLPLICATAFVLHVYCADSGSSALDVVLLNLPRTPLKRLGSKVLHVTPLAISNIIFTSAVGRTWN